MSTESLSIEGLGVCFAVPAPDPTPSPAPGPEPAPGSPQPPPTTRRWAGLMFLVGLAAGAWLQVGTRTSDGVAIGGGGGGVRTALARTADLPASIRLGGTITAQQFAAIRAPQIRTGRRGGGGGAGGAGLAGGGGGGAPRGGAMTLITMAEPGATVAKGEIVAEFDRQSQQQAIDRQQALVVQAGAMIDSQRARLMIEMETKRQDLVNAKAEHDKAELDLGTAEVLSEIQAEILKNAVQEAKATQEQLAGEVTLLEEAHKAAMRTFEIDRQQEEIDLRRAEMNADHMLVKTPISGIVVMQTTFRGGSFSQTAEGDEVRPGSYFMQIVDPTSMVLEAQVNQADSQRVRVGLPATVRLDAYPDESWPGRVVSVAAMTGGSQRGRFRTGTGAFVRNITVTIAILEQDARIIPDLSASADIVMDTHENVLIAPREALRKDGDDWFVQVRQGAEEFIRKAVEIGAMSDTHVVVTAGLSEGDEIALEPVAAGSRRSR